MAKVKRYRLIDGFNLDDWKDKYGFKDGGSWACKDSEHYILKSMLFDNYEFSVYLCLPSEDKIKDWNDYDYMLVIDDDFVQPYDPFYKHYEEEVDNYWCLEQLINMYNRWMDSLEFLKEAV